MPRKNSLISVVRNDAGLLTFTVGEAGSFEIDPNGLPDDIKTIGLAHGIVQKISDAAAMPKSELTGNAKKDAKTKFEAMKSVADRLLAGDWSKRRGDGTGPVAGILFRAFAQYVVDQFNAAKKTAPTEETIRARYDAMSRSEQFALRKIPEVAAIMDTMRTDSSKVDATELLNEFGL